ncbi:MAG: PadR family transcriptional regulator [Promethearchaeota archaeon]
MKILKSFKRSAIMAHILYHTSKESVYGSWLLEELSSHGYKISPGSLYPWLNDLLDQNLLVQTERIVNGKVRKYYDITEQGREEFRALKHFLRELYSEIFEHEI